MTTVDWLYVAFILALVVAYAVIVAGIEYLFCKFWKGP